MPTSTEKEAAVPLVFVIVGVICTMLMILIVFSIVLIVVVIIQRRKGRKQSDLHNLSNPVYEINTTINTNRELNNPIYESNFRFIHVIHVICKRFSIQLILKSIC